MEVMRSQRLEVVGLGCKYGDKWVLKDISFSVSPGEAVGVVGPSGSGKTTLAYCLVGIIPKRIRAEILGSVYVDGVKVQDLDISENSRLINVVLQNYEMQIFGLTVEEDLLFTLENMELDEREMFKRLEWALEKFGLKKYRRYQVNELSGGLRQRLAIVSVLLANPKYLVMDDPMTNLDWNGIMELREVLCKLKDEGKGLVVMSRRLKGLEPVIDKTIRLLKKNHVSDTPVLRAIDISESSFNPEPLVVFEGVWFKYNGDFILKNIDLKINRGECISIMGPNGSGKTTLAKHINGLLKPVRGRVLILGKDTRRFSTAQLARHVGFVFQDPDKHIAWENVWDEAVFGARNLKIGDKYAEEALEILGLAHRKNDPPYQLSAGEKVRLSVVGALAMNPDVLILDEPTTGQDEETLSIISFLIRSLKYKGKTTVIITHDSDFALNVSDRVIVMNDGKIIADDHPIRVLLDEEIVKIGLEPVSEAMITRARAVLDDSRA